MSNAVEGRRFAHEELRKEVNDVMASEEGQLFRGMFSREAHPSTYPFPKLDFHDSSAKVGEAPRLATGALRSSSIQELISVLEETAANAVAPGDRY